MAGAAGKRSFETRDGPSSFNELPSRIQLHVADILTQVGKLTLKGLTEFLRVNKIDYPPTKDKAYLQKVTKKSPVGSLAPSSLSELVLPTDSARLRELIGGSHTLRYFCPTWRRCRVRTRRSGRCCSPFALS